MEKLNREIGDWLLVVWAVVIFTAVYAVICLLDGSLL